MNSPAVRIVRDTAILVREHDGAKGPTRNLLLRIIESDHELARVLRYPRMLALHGLSDGRIYDCIGFLRAAREIVRPNPLPVIPIRDVNDTAVMQTAIIGGAEFLCTKDAFRAQPGSFRVPGGVTFSRIRQLGK